MHNRNFRGNKPPRPQQRTPDIDYFNQVEKDYATTAEDVIKRIEYLPSTSSIRNILALINNVSMKVANCQESKLPQDIINDISYLKVRIAYSYGRDRSSFNPRSSRTYENQCKLAVFIDETRLLELLLCVNTKQKYEIFAKYVEALIAYHKYYGGKDK
jgi:CRISPR-associated protein Csm2